MAGYRYTNDEREFLVGITKEKVEQYDKAVKSAINNKDEIGAYSNMRKCDVARSALAKLEGTFTQSEA